MKRAKPKQKNKHDLSPRVESELAASSMIPITSDLPYPRVKHSVNIGDLYAAMGALKKYHDITGRKVIVCQKVNQIAAYYAGAEHPTKNEQGQQVCINEAMWNMLKPLIESQEYVYAFEKYEGQKIDIDFDVIRGKTFVNLPHGAIQQWIPIAFPDLQFNLSNQWITLKGDCPQEIKDIMKGKVMINFTERYRNDMMDYYFLQNYAPDLIFAGTEKEHFIFCNRWNLNVQRLIVSDFLELAYALREARFMLGNQSSLWNLAEAMKTPRILELCSIAPNCQIMVGENSLGYYHQVGLEYSFRVLYNTTHNKTK